MNRRIDRIFQPFVENNLLNRISLPIQRQLN